jgi:hypothetical protein
VSKDPKEIKGFQILDEAAAKALDDDNYRQALLADPTAVLRDAGLIVPDDLEVVVVENTQQRVYLALPARPPAEVQLDVSEVDLTQLLPFTVF